MSKEPPSNADGHHDDLREHAPRIAALEARYQITLYWAERFRTNANHYAAPCPAGYNPIAWRLLYDSALSMAEEKEREAEELARQLGE